MSAAVVEPVGRGVLVMEVKTSWGLQKCWVKKLGNHNALHYPSEHWSDGYWSEIRLPPVHLHVKL